MSTLTYNVNIRRKSQQELVVETLDFALRTGYVRDPERRKDAEDAIRATVTALLRRKRLTPEDEQRIRARWGEYVA